MKIKAVAIGLGTVVLLAASGIYGLDVYASRHAEEWAAVVLEQLPPRVEATHGKLSCGWFCDPLVIEDVVLSADLPWTKDIHVGRMTVSGMNGGLWDMVRGRLPDFAAARSIVLERVEADQPNAGHQSIERVEMIGPRLDHRVDRSRETWTLVQWLRAFSLASAEATKIHATVDQKERGISFDAHIASRSISGIKAGLLVGEVDKDVTADLNMLPGKAHMDLAESRTAALDLVGLVQLFDHDGERDPTYYALGDTTLSGLKVTIEPLVVPTITVALDSLSVSGLKMRQFPFPLTDPPENPTPAQVLDALRSLSLGGMELKQLAVTVKTALFPVNVEIGDFVMKMGEGRLEHGEFDRVALRMPGFNYSLGTASLDGLAIHLPEGFLDRDPEEWKEHLPGMPKVFFDRYHVADVSAQSPFAGSLSLKEFTETMSGTIDKPTGMRFDMTDLAIDFTMLALLKPMRNFDYRSVTFAAHAEDTYDYDAKTFALTEWTFSAPEMGTLSANCRLSNFPFGELEGGATKEALGIALSGISIDSAELRYDDASLVEHLIAVLADHLHQTPEAARQTAISAVEQQKASLSKTFLSDAPRALGAFDQVIAFLREPKSIRLSVKPPSPISLAQAVLIGEKQPGKVLDLLNVTVDRP